MTTHDHDTDPSTPGAKRLPDAPPAAVVPGAAVEGTPSGRDPALGRTTRASPPPPGPGPLRKSTRRRPTTDPGVAPPPPPLPVPSAPMGIVVPSAAFDGDGSAAAEEAIRPLDALDALDAEADDDSVDVLLEGIAREQPERPKATHDSSRQGQRIAAQPAAPLTRPAQNVSSGEPKVVIDHAALGPTLRGDRGMVSLDTRPSTETTEPTGASLVPRVVVAVLAGLLVVTVIFVALKRTSRAPAPEGAGTTASVQPSPVAAAPRAVLANAAESAAAAPPVAPVAPVASDGPSSPPSPSAIAANASPRKGAPAGKAAVKAKSRPPTAPKATGTDLGEFKGAL